MELFNNPHKIGASGSNCLPWTKPQEESVGQNRFAVLKFQELQGPASSLTNFLLCLGKKNLENKSVNHTTRRSQILVI